MSQEDKGISKKKKQEILKPAMIFLKKQNL